MSKLDKIKENRLSLETSLRESRLDFSSDKDDNDNFNDSGS